MTINFLVDDDKKLDYCKAQLSEQFNAHSALRVSVDVGGGELLCDVFERWSRDICCWYFKCDAQVLTRGVVVGTQRTIKELFFSECGHEWILHEVECAITKRKKRDFIDVALLGDARLMLLLQWMQSYFNSRCKNLGLQSFGKYKRLTEKK